MDYSQFLMMPQELGLLIVFLLVFLFDTFMPKKAQSSLSIFTCVAFAAFTIANLFLFGTGTVFAGMFEQTSATYAMKFILNAGVLIVLIQATQWANSEFVSVRRGEFYELLLATLFGMYLMISARHFLLFVIGLETKIWRGFSLGWTARYKKRLNHKTTETGKAWYVPGYGENDNHLFTGTFNAVLSF